MIARSPISAPVRSIAGKTGNEAGRPVWLPDGAVWGIGFDRLEGWQGGRLRRIEDLPGYSFARTGSAWALRSGPQLGEYPQDLAQFAKGRGYVAEEARTNQCEMDAEPDQLLAPTSVATFESTFPGQDVFDAGTGALFGAVDQSEVMAAAGLSGVCPNGRAWVIDNTGGSGAALINVAGTTASGPLDQTYSAWIWSDTTTDPTRVQLGQNGSPTALPALSATPTRYTVTQSGVAAGKKLQVLAQAGHRVYFVIPCMEQGSFGTEAIVPASGGSTTRALGDLSIDLGLTSGEWRNVPIPGGGFLTPDDGFWVYVEYKQRAGFKSNSRIVEMSDGTTANRVTLLQNTTLGGPQWQVFVSSAAQAALGSSESNGPIKAAASFLPNDIGAAINGAATARDTSASLPTISEIVIGLSAGGANPANTDIALVAIGQGTLTDAQLEDLSS